MLAKKALSAAPAAVAQYVEDVFSTYLYTSTAATQTITNNIDLSGEGGLVWLKRRNSSTQGSNWLTDTARGAGKELRSDTTNAETTFGYMSAFGSSGFTDGGQYPSGATIASWTFRKAEKFFDVVTYTGNGTAGRTVAHNLGSTPGCIIVKRTDTTEDWGVYHTSTGNTKALFLNGTSAADTNILYWNNTSPTSTQFSVGSWGGVNANGGTYVAYLFAHDAGGFGDAGDQSVIKCSNFTCDGSGNATIDLGWEPQLVILKRTDNVENWEIYDTMRGLTVSSGQRLRPSSSESEVNSGETQITNTGFKRVAVAANSTYVYIAIRRGPMKTPEVGTEVFTPQVYNSSASSPAFTTSYPPDAAIRLYKTGGASAQGPIFASRLTGTEYLQSSSTAAGATDPDIAFYQNGFNGGSLTTAYVGEMFRRAPGFFDVVCYTGTGSATTFSHNLGVAPELMIVKARSATGSGNWPVYSSARGATKYLLLNLNSQEAAASTIWNDTSPTSSVFSVGTSTAVNGSGGTYVAYLFSSVSGVSKVGTYTGNGTSQTINCGFTSGARFVLIKTTSTTGDWVVFDSARGIVSGDDPYLLLNSTAAEVTNKDAVDTDNTGFVVNETTGPNINTNSATYIYLAIA